MSPGTTFFLFILFILLGILSALVSAMETTLFSLKEHYRSTWAAKHPKFVSTFHSISTNQKQYLNYILLINTIVTTGFSILALFLIPIIAVYYQINLWTAALLTFACIILFTEIAPKLIALTNPKLVFRTLAGPFLNIEPFLKTITNKLVAVSEFLIDHILPKKLRPRSEILENELDTLIEMQKEKGTLHNDESQLIQEVIHLGSKIAKDCMTPRVDTLTLNSNLKKKEVDALIKKNIFWKIPVYKKNPDTIIGVLNVKRYLQNPEKDYHTFIDPPVFVSETTKAITLLESYLTEPHSIVIILDEYGGFEGIVTHTDMLEEIFEDAVPTLELENEIAILDENRLLVSGSTRLEEINKNLGSNLDGNGIDTIGGFLFTSLGHIPQKEEIFTIGNIVITIRKCSETRIQEVLLEKVGEEIHRMAG